MAETPKNEIDHAVEQAAMRDTAHNHFLAALHRFVVAAGGRVTINKRELPLEIPLHFQMMSDGTGVITALPPTRNKPRLLTPRELPGHPSG